jgi:rod shape determining protein RodA
MSKLWREFDWVLFLAMLALVCIGLVMIFSSYEASLPPSDRPLMENTVFRQGLFAAIGLVAYLVFAAVDYHELVALNRWIFVFCIAFLGLTALVGQTRFGARSWLNIVNTFGGQPSELVKVLMIVVLARHLGQSHAAMESIKPLLASIAILIPPAALIYVQPDFGTALILVATWVGMVFLAGVRWRFLALFASIGAILTPVIWFQMEDYMRLRVITFLYPESDPSGASYNIMQALISIGSGGLWGKGLLQGTQSQLYFLRVRHTDFVFSVLAEEFGFVGSMLLLALFIVLLLRLVRIGLEARDTYGRLIAGGVATMIFVQAFINLAMNANLIPVTGLPLPLVSYGGSSLINTLAALGLAQGVAMRHKRTESPLGSR